MAFKQSNNPISRKTSPLRAGGFTMKDIEDKSTAEKISSIEESRSGNVGAPGDPGTRPNYNDAKKFAGDDEGMLKHKMSPEEYDLKYTAPSRKASPLNGNMTKHMSKKNPKKATERAPNEAYKEAPSRKASPLNDEGHAKKGKAHSHYKTDKYPEGQVPKASAEGMKNKK